MKSQVSSRLNRQICGRHKSCWTCNICYTAAPPLKSTSRRLHIETSSSHLLHSLAPPEFLLQNVQDIFFFVGGYANFTLIRNGCWGYADGTPDERTTSAPHHEFLHRWNAEYVTHLQHDIRTWLHQNFFFRMFRTSFSSLEGMSISPSSGTDVGGYANGTPDEWRPALRITTPSIGETLSAPRTSDMTSELDSIRTSLQKV